MEIVSQKETSKTNTENRKRESVIIEEKEKGKRKDEEQREEERKKQRTDEMKEVQKGFEDKGKHTCSPRYKYYSSIRFKVEDTQPD